MSFSCLRFSVSIDKINNIARYNLIDTKYRQISFQLARWGCSHALFGTRVSIVPGLFQFSSPGTFAGTFFSIWFNLIEFPNFAF